MPNLATKETAIFALAIVTRKGRNRFVFAAYRCAFVFWLLKGDRATKFAHLAPK